MLQVKNISKKYKDFILEPINFQLPSGTVLGIIGKNGAGKTTLLKGILHQFPIDGGEVIYDERKMSKDYLNVKGKMGFLSQEAPFLQEASLKLNAAVFGGFYPDFSMDLFTSYLHSFSLYEDQIYSQCSKGMKIKFQLAFLLSHKPKIILMDEPTAGLDAGFRIEFLSILQSYIEKEMATVLFSTNITDDLDKIADYILILSNGRMVFFDTKENMMENMKLVSGKADMMDKLKEEYFYGFKIHGEYRQGLTLDFEIIKRQVEELNLGVSRPNLEQILYFVDHTSVKNYKQKEAVDKNIISSESIPQKAAIPYSWQHQKKLEDMILQENSSGIISLSIMHIFLFFINIYLTVNYESIKEQIIYCFAVIAGGLSVEWAQRTIIFRKRADVIGQNIFTLYMYYPVIPVCLILSKLKRIVQNTCRQMIMLFVLCALLLIRLGIIQYILLIVICGGILFMIQSVIVGFSVLKFMIYSDRINTNTYNTN